MRQALVIAVMASLFVLPAAAQKTPAPLVDSYDALANTILALRDAELGLVKAILARHREAVEDATRQADWQTAAAEIALFANEGDNAVGGVRKRLLEGGHHFNSSGEEQGVFDEGFVVVTREARKKCLELSSALRQASSNEERHKALQSFAKLADELLSGG